MKKERSNINKGFSLVETLLTIGLFTLLATTFVSSLIHGQESERLAGDRARAVFLAEEGLEAVRNMRDENFNNVAAGTHGLATSGNRWSFSGNFDATDIFTREIIVTDDDVHTKTIVANVTWKQNEQRDGIVSSTSRLTDWQVANPTESEQLSVNTNNSRIQSGGTFQATDVTMENIGIEDIAIASTQVSWSGVSSGARLTGINMNGNSVWTGSDASGSSQDISDFTLFLGGGTYPLVFVFDKMVNNITLTVSFIMADGSAKEVVFKPGSPADTTPPSDVANLSVSGPTTTALNLAWTSPGDDGGSGTAASYDIRYSISMITEANWASATQVSGEPVPSVAGSSESMTVTGLSLGTTYYFSIKTSDEILNISGLSNVASAATLAAPQANYLIVGTGNAILSANKRDALGITLQNSGPANITVTSINVSWSGVAANRRLNSINMSGAVVWIGSVASGLTNDINPDSVLATGAAPTLINYLRFNNTISNIILSLTFNMSDGSTKTVSGIGPLL